MLPLTLGSTTCTAPSFVSSIGEETVQDLSALSTGVGGGVSVGGSGQDQGGRDGERDPGLFRVSTLTQVRKGEGMRGEERRGEGRRGEERRRVEQYNVVQ